MGTVMPLMRLTMVSAFAKVVACGRRAVEPSLHQIARLRRWHAGLHLYAEFRHAHLRASPHAASKNDIYLLGRQPMSPAAWLERRRRDLSLTQDLPFGRIHLKQGHLRGAPKVEREGAVFS